MAKPKLALIPSGYSDGKVFSVLPANGDGDFDFSRGSRATRVNKDGLIETMPLELGEELVTNGNFATDSDWNKSTGWTISGSELNATSVTTSSAAYQLASISVGKTYKVVFEITSYTNGGVALRAGTSSAITYFSGVGVHTNYINVTGGTLQLRFNTSSTSTLSIDNVSVKEVISGLDTPRLDYSDSSCPSLLLEPQRTNLIEYSEDFSNSSWSKLRTSIVSNSTISPDGSLNASKIVEDTSNGTHILYKNNVATGAGINTLSVKVKANGRNWVSLYDAEQGEAVYFDLENGVAGSTIGSPDDYSITALPNGWYDISLTTTATSKVDFQIYTAEVDGNNSYQGDGVSGIYVWGAQLEQGSYATSYIPTNGATATRYADVCNSAGTSDTFNDSEGVLMFEGGSLSELDVTPRYIQISDGTTTANGVQLRYYTSTNSFQALYYTNSAYQAVLTYTLPNSSENNKIVFKYKENDFALWVNGIEVDADLTGVTGASLSKLKFDYNNFSDFYGNTKQLQYFDSSLTDSEIEELTSWESFIKMANGQNYTIE